MLGISLIFECASRYRLGAAKGPRLLGPDDFNQGQPVTNFEAKYVASSQPTYELLLGYNEGELGDEADADRGARHFFPEPT